MLMIKTDSDKNQKYEECRYLRMDGLEAFMEESLATRYSNTPDTHKNHVISVISGIDTHFLPDCIQIPDKAIFQNKIIRLQHPTPPVRNRTLSIYTPPDILFFA